MMFLYLTDVEIYPSQTMIHYSYVYSQEIINPDNLLKYGYWNSELKEKWIKEADYILVESRFFKSDWRPRVDAGELTIVDITGPVEACREKDSRVLVLQYTSEMGEE